jgi:hypothetical protein
MRGVVIAALYVLIGILIQDLVFDLDVVLGRGNQVVVQRARAYHQGIEEEPFAVTLALVGVLIVTFVSLSTYNVFFSSNRRFLDVFIFVASLIGAPLWVTVTLPAEQALIQLSADSSTSDFCHMQFTSSTEKALDLIFIIGVTHLALLVFSAIALVIHSLTPTSVSRRKAKRN